MQISPIELDVDLESIKSVANRAFSLTPDSMLEEWFSFEEMIQTIKDSRGVCLKATNDDAEIVGMIYAQQESPINAKESLEKWVIILAAVPAELSGKGIGTELLTAIESQAEKRNVKKMFVFTNKDDERVVNFYNKNGYEDAGWIKDYQYGKGNSAVFLLKYLQ